jgi:hypothetical protein
MYGRAGDHLMTKFQCDCCHIRNIRERDQLVRSGSDDMLFMCIWRATLDSLWSRELTTVENNRRQIAKLLEKGNMLDLRAGDLLAPTGPQPLADDIHDGKDMILTISYYLAY